MTLYVANGKFSMAGRPGEEPTAAAVAYAVIDGAGEVWAVGVLTDSTLESQLLTLGESVREVAITR